MVRFTHVAHAYQGREVLADVTLAIGAETLLVSGPTGAGKSVLLRLLAGFETPRRGWITADGVPLVGSRPDVLAAHRRRLALVPQRPLLASARTAIQNVALALETQGVAVGAAHERAAAVLGRVGIEALADRRVSTLSAGERRLVSLARALVREDARLVIADEPAADLEARAQHRVGTLLAERAARGATVIVASRQPGLAGLGPHRVVFLDGGRVVWDSQGAVGTAAS